MRPEVGMRKAGPGDLAAVEAFLLQHADAAMFPLDNLRAHGLEDGDFGSPHAHAQRIWMLDDGPSGVLAVTRGGMLMPVPPVGGDAERFAEVLAGLDITGAVGPVSQLRALLVGWRADYHREILGTPADRMVGQAGAEIDACIARDSHRVLVVEGRPVAMTAFNAMLTEIVQIGGVYTPPALRNRGYARLAVTLHLAEPAVRGVRRAVLFAASCAAARAYRGIGFQPAGSVALVVFDGPQRMRP